MKLQNLIDHGIKNNASDILLSTGNSPYYRIFTELSSLKIDPLTREQIETFLKSLLPEVQYNVYLEQLECNYVINYDKYRLRIRAFNDLNGPACIIRIISSSNQTFETLNAPTIITEFCKINKGLILITGENSSGVSSTLNAMINYINNNYKKHIVIIEDLPEYIYFSQQSLINQKKISSTICQEALQASMLENPDIIVIESITTPSQIKFALQAAEKGYLILSTFHTKSATFTIERILSLFLSEEKDLIKSLLLRTLEGIISQTLLKKLDGSGLKAAFEIMNMTNPIRNLIKNGNIQDIDREIEKSKDQGMITMKDSITSLIQQGIVSSDIILQEFDYKINENVASIDNNKDSF